MARDVHAEAAESVDEGVEPVTRRAPFSDNPLVGARGQRTRQRIIDAALLLFGDEGYHRTSVARISEQATCSRVAFYQYFSSKEDVFSSLAGQVARAISASTEAIDPLAPDAGGWDALRAWVGRYGDIHEHYGPIFQALPAALAEDAKTIAAAARLRDETVDRLRSSLSLGGQPVTNLNALLSLLLACLRRTLDNASTLRLYAPSDYSRERVEVAFTDVMHRALFGRSAVNVHMVERPHPPRLDFGPITRDMLAKEEAIRSNAEQPPALKALMEHGRAVFVRRGYHATRVDDLADAAGVSHGVFYRYFENKDQLAIVLTVQAMRVVADAFVDIPDLATDDPGDLQRWLRRYNAAQAGEAAMIRIWVDAALEDARLRSVSASSLDWGRRRMVRILAERGCGDVDVEAVVMVALLGAFGAQPPSSPTVEAAADIIQRGLLGQRPVDAVRRGSPGER
jgi:AcrR family transcriptional regulator